MPEKTKNIIKLVAIFLVLYGGFELLSSIKGVWWSIQSFFYLTSNTFWEIIYFSSLIFFFSLMLPIGAICGGIGLLRQRKWGWILSKIVSLVIFTMSFAATINFAIASYYYRNIPIPPIPEGAVVGYVSMIPTYITTFISLAFITVLNRKSVKNLFVQFNESA